LIVRSLPVPGDGPGFPRRHRDDLIALGMILLTVAVVMTFRWIYDNWLTEYDIFSFFLPMYGILGDRLRNGDIPGWTPLFSSGSPIAGDPSSGWGYLLAMIPFTFLSVPVAFKTMVLCQLLIGGIATYVLCRVIGYRPSAASMATVAFTFGPFVAAQTMFATVAGQVATWIPVALLAVERGLRSARLGPRLSWCGLAGLAISQMIAAWPGQGMMNGLLVVAAWTLYRGLGSRHGANENLRIRLTNMAITGIATFGAALGLGAAILFPLFLVNLQSSIVGGDYTNVFGGDYLADPYSPTSLLKDLVGDVLMSRTFGIIPVTLILGTLGALISFRRNAVPFWLAMYLIPVVLSFSYSPIHYLVYLIPGFETIHEHAPRRAIWVMPLAPAMLAGAAIQELPSLRGKAGAARLLAPLLAVLAIGLFLLAQDPAFWIGWWVAGVAILATLLVFVAAGVGLPSWLRHSRAARAAVVGLITLAVVAPAGRDIVDGIRWSEDDDHIGHFWSTDRVTRDALASYLRPTEPVSAASFLQNEQRSGGPFRFVGYAGRNYAPDPRADQSYSLRRLEPAVLSVLINGRGAFLGLQQIQGYNPTHLAHYAEYFEAMNGAPQDYHWFDPFPSAIADSQLFDMLGVRYVLVSRTIPSDRADVVEIGRGREIAYQDQDVTIYENSEAFDRAWIVHDVRPNNDGESLALFQSGRTDARQVAYVDGAVPPVVTVSPEIATRESVTIGQDDGDTVSATATLAAPGLVVFADVYADGWKAWVDGEPVDILRTNHALRGVPVGPGEHTIEMRYEPRKLTVGLLISGVSGAGVLGVFALASGRWLRDLAARREPASSEVAPSRPGQPLGAPDGSLGTADATRFFRDP